MQVNVHVLLLSSQKFHQPSVSFRSGGAQPRKMMKPGDCAAHASSHCNQRPEQCTAICLSLQVAWCLSRR